MSNYRKIITTLNNRVFLNACSFSNSIAIYRYASIDENMCYLLVYDAKWWKPLEFKDHKL